VQGAGILQGKAWFQDLSMRNDIVAYTDTYVLAHSGTFLGSIGTSQRS
jgi:hypothetical protein